MVCSGLSKYCLATAQHQSGTARPASPHVISGTAARTRHTHSPQTTSTMNSLYTLGVRQSSSIQADLERLRASDTSASLLGLSPPLTRSDLVTAHSGISGQGRYLLRSQE